LFFQPWLGPILFQRFGAPSLISNAPHIIEWCDSLPKATYVNQVALLQAALISRVAPCTAHETALVFPMSRRIFSSWLISQLETPTAEYMRQTFQTPRQRFEGTPQV
jgi:hypothetical protein